MASTIVADASVLTPDEKPAPPRHARRTVKLDRQPAKRARADGTERVGRVLRERWRVDELVWKTQVSALYWATHRTGTRVAIQVLHPELSADPERQLRFVEAATRGRAIGHDGVVRVLDDDVDADGALFLVLELFEATSLAWMFEAARGPFELGEALRIADGLLDVMAAAHAKGIQHGALSPDDVFVTRPGQVKVLGFEGELDGNFRRDTAALGRLLFTMFAGTPPNGASLGAQEARVPQELVDVVDRALGVGEAEPFRDATEMQAAFRAVAHDCAPEGPAISFRVSGRMNPLFLGPISETRPKEREPVVIERRRSSAGRWLFVLAALVFAAAALLLTRT